MAATRSPRRARPLEALASVRQDFRLGGLLLMGMGVGISLTVSGGTIGFWLAENGFSPSEIGFLALAMLPFVLKFVWAPLLEGSFRPLARILGFRKSWLIPLNLATASSIVFLSQADPGSGSIMLVAIGAFLFAFFAASQEVVIEGLRIDRTQGPSLPIGVTLVSIGARIGMLVGSAGALIIAARAGWPVALMSMAGLMLLVSVGAMILGDSRKAESGNAGRLALGERFVGPFREFFTREGAMVMFTFMLLIRLGDSMAGAMFPPFAIEAGFTKDQIAFASSMVGFFAVMIGSLAGVAIYRTTSERTGLLIAVAIVALSNIGFVALTYVPGDTFVLAGAMAFENFAGGIGAVMLLSFMSRLTNVRFTASQFALFTAAAALSRLGIAGPSGLLVEAVGYRVFFVVTILASVPALFCLFAMIRRNLVADVNVSRREDAPTGE